MQWPSPWGWGFPGWHIECSAMGAKYLGDTFDIHGGGMDLQATHHTNEIAQSQACNNTSPVKYWMHTNMLTVNGVRMSKSAGNGFFPHELFTGNHPLLERGYAPMVVRFFMAQSHYRSTLDFSNEALQGAEKGFQKLMNAGETLDKLEANSESTINIDELSTNCYKAMNDDFNSPILIAHLFEAVRIINLINDGKESINNSDLESLKSLFKVFVFDVLGLKADDKGESSGSDLTGDLIDMILNLRLDAKKNKDFATSDKIRDELTNKGVTIKDTKDGFEWQL
jgi:cysteinyl-tRNA synthetase